MKLTPSMCLGLLLIAACNVAPASEPASAPRTAATFDFDKDVAGELPVGWHVQGTRSGRGGAGAGLARWKVVAEASAPSRPQALAVIASTHGEQDTFNLCWTDGVAFRDGKLSVSLQAVGGEVDQGGGLVWRMRDRDNYYICRANPLESNFRVYRVIDGVRHQLGSATVEMKVGDWHRIEVVTSGPKIICTLDGGAKLEAEDMALTAAGGVGCWTKADALTRFDDLRVEPAP